MYETNHIMKKHVTVFLFLILNSFLLTSQDLSLSWVNTYNGGHSQGVADENILDLITDANGNLIIVGFYTDTMDLDPGIDTLTYISYNEARELFIMKMDSLGSLIWVKTVVGNSAETVYSLDLDSSGNIYMAGYYWGTVDFDPGSGVESKIAAGNSGDSFILKLDENGMFVWVKVNGSLGNDGCTDLFIDNNEYIYALGSYKDSIDMDPGDNISMLVSPNVYNNYLLKLDLDGNYIWAKNITEGGSPPFAKMSHDSNGNIYFGGKSYGTIDFDSDSNEEIVVSDNSDICVLKVDSSGNFLWVRVMGGSHSDRCRDIVCDNNDNVIITGDYRGNSDLDPGPGVLTLPGIQNGYEVFVAKLDSTGDLLWASPIYGPSSEFCYSVDVDENNNVYTTGAFHSTTDFDPSSGVYNITASYFDWFILKLSESGQLIWVETFGDEEYESGGYIHVDNDNIYVTGGYDDPFTIYNNDSSFAEVQGIVDIFLAKFKQCSATDVAPVPLISNLAELTFSCSLEELSPPQALNSCGDPIIGTTNAVFPISSIGTTVIEWTYSNSFGTSIIQEQNIIILIDDVAPLPTLTNLSDIIAQCSVEELTYPSAIDNCSSVSVSHDVMLPIVLQGSTTITWTYTDESGNISSQTQTVTIDDTEAPVPNLNDLNDIVSECSLDETPVAPTAIDNCSGDIISGTTDAIFPITTLGSTNITWTYIDANGNESTQIQVIIIEDSQLPVPEQEILIDLLSECSIEMPISPTAFDSCSGQTIVGISDVTFPITTIGITTIIWSFDDGNGNIASQTQNATISPIDNSYETSQNVISANAEGYTYQWIDCNNGNQAIEGENDQSYTANTNGSFAVIISNEDCSVSSDCVEIIFNSIDELALSGLSIYPNPASDFIFIESKIDGIIDLEILDLKGKIIDQIQIQGKQNEISISELATGNYILKATHNNSVKHIKFVKL